MKFIDDIRLKAGVWARERKERAEVRKMERDAAKHQGEHGHGRFFLLHIPATATIFAAFVEVYWALLFCIEATGQLVGHFDWAAAWNAPWRFIWDFAFSGNVFVLLGLLAATAPIVMISMVWLPVQFAMRGFGRWRRGTLITVGLLANAIVILSGTVVMNANRQEQVRAGLVVEQQGDASRAAIGARLQVAQTELARITAEGNTSNEARAARAGVAGWRTYVREAQNDPQVPPPDRQRIVRAMGSAEAADALRARIEALTVQQATASPAAATAAHIEDTTGASLNAFAEGVKVWRPPLIAIGCTLIGILGAWWTLAMLLHMNPRDVLRSGWADEGHRIEDKREEGPLPVDPAGMRPPREVVTDAETGEELIRIQPKPHWRKRKGKPQQVETWPDIPPDERGVEQDGGARIGSALPKAVADNDVSGVLGASENQTHVTDAEVQPEQEARDADERAESYPEQQLEHAEPPIEEPTEDEAAAALHELELIATPVETPAEASDEPQEERPEDDRAEQDNGYQHDDTFEHEPITDQARLLPAK